MVEALKILVVEVEPDTRQQLARMLRADGFTVLEASQGKDALTLAHAQAPDLILSVDEMPVMNGYQLLAALRADPDTSAIPFVFISGSTDRKARRRAMNLGADDYLGKPFTEDEVLDAVHARIQRTQSLEQSSFFGSIDLPIEDTKPAEIKGYEIVQRLGGGGMSEVFLAVRETDGLTVALKILNTRIHRDAGLLDRFIQEYALLESIDHPNVARIYDHGFTDEHAFITMEYFDRGDIKRKIASHMSPYEALAVTIQVALALSQIHALGIIHRDLKPDNLMLRADGRIALIDFGVAKHTTPLLEHTQHGEIVGSPYYMSPEQASGQPVSPASDIYCLGVLFFEMITGKRPYAADTMEGLLYQHVHAPVPELEAKFSEFQVLVNRTMAKDPAKRFKSAKSVVEYISSAWPTVIRIMREKELPHGATARTKPKKPKVGKETL